MALKWINERVTCSELDENFSASAEAIGSPVTKSPSQEIGMQPSPSATTNDWSHRENWVVVLRLLVGLIAPRKITLLRWITFIWSGESIEYFNIPLYTGHNSITPLMWCIVLGRGRFVAYFIYKEGGLWQARRLESCWPQALIPQLGSQIVKVRHAL